MSQAPSAQPPAHPTRVIALAAAVQGIGGGLAWSLLPPLLPQISLELGLSNTMAAVVWGAAPLGIALAAPLGGAAADRYGARNTVVLALLFGALACAARALVSDGLGLAAAMFAFGLHVGFVAPAIPKALAGHVPLQKLGKANGLALLAYTLGTAATVLTARTYLAPFFGGWRETMVAAGGAMVLVSLLFWLGVRDRGAPRHSSTLGDILRLTRDPQLLRIAGIHFLLFGGYLALLGLLPKVLLGGGVAPAAVGAVVATWLVAAGVANFLGPWLSDRLGRRRPLVLIGSVVAGLGLAAVALVTQALSGGSVGTETAIACLIVAALGGGSFAPLLLVMPVELSTVGPARVGAAMGLLMLVGQAGGFLLPLAAGVLADAAGYSVAIGFIALAHLLIPAVARGLRETGAARATAPAVAASVA